MQNHMLEMKNISLEFPGVKALSNVDFSIKSGEIRAVVGANGAGKSSLMKVLSGANETYTGDIFIDGNHQEIRKPKTAKDQGIEIVYQEVDTALVPYLSVAENIMLNALITKSKNKLFIKWRHIRKSAQRVLNTFKMNLDVNAQVSSLTLAEKQMVLIARAVREKCKFLILDEPTAPLSMSEVDELFRIVKELAEYQNVGIMFITHRLSEVFQICKSITIMRDGNIVANIEMNDSLTINNIITHMLGKSFEENFPKVSVPVGDIQLEVSNISDIEGKVNDVSFYVKSGEIVGISGLVGSGKTELCKLIFGANRASRGTIKLKGKEIRIHSPTMAVKNRIALIPEERRREGVLVSEPVYVNLSAACLGKFCNRFSFVQKTEELKSARGYIEKLDISTPSEFQQVKFLSGGNQQKVVVGKWIASESDVYIMDEPTKGVDVGAKRDIFNLIQSLVSDGKSIIYMSSDISEILAISDRVYVLYNGGIAAELITKETNEEEILFYSTGGKKDAYAAHTV